MNKTEVNAKLQYVFEGLPLNRVQKEMLGDVVMTIIETAVAGVTEPEIAKASNDTLGGIKTGYSQNAKNYPVSLDGDGKAFVNVPWADNNTTYSAGIGLSLSGTTFAVKTEFTTSGKNYKVTTDSSGNLYVNVPWTDTNTTYNVASSSADGLMSKEDKAKLDNIANNANNYSLPNATTSIVGGVKQATTVEALEEADEIATVISTVNTLISNLKTAGIVANS